MIHIDSTQLQEAEIKEVGMIGPATVGGIKPEPENMTPMAPMAPMAMARMAYVSIKARMHSHWEHRCPMGSDKESESLAPPVSPSPMEKK